MQLTMNPAMNQTTQLVALTDQGVIRASGADAASFLHNLMTNDIEHIPAGGARNAGLCTAKGRLIASFLIWREGDDFLLQLSADILPAILKKFSMYVLRSKVKLTDLAAERVLLGVIGPHAADIVKGLGAQTDAAMTSASFDGGTAVRLDDQRFILSIQSDASAATLAKLAAQTRAAELAAWHLGEIAAGIPRIVAATQEAFVPQMVNYEIAAVGGVSFQKGCYPGQEIVARTQYLGKIKRRMYRAKLDSDVPPGTDVFTSESGDQHCGAIVLSAPSPAGGFESLVVVQSSGVEAGKVHVGSPTGPRLSILPLPYVVE